jgi:hypothetical protein
MWKLLKVLGELVEASEGSWNLGCFSVFVFVCANRVISWFVSCWFGWSEVHFFHFFDLIK